MQKLRFLFSIIKFKKETLRYAAGLISGMALVLGTPFVFADSPTATPPDGDVIPNFSAMDVGTYIKATDYNASSGIWIGGATKTGSMAIISLTEAYLYANDDGRLSSRSISQPNTLYGVNQKATIGQSGVVGSITTVGKTGATTTSGSLGYRDATGVYGLYTSGAAKIGSLYVSEGLYIDAISSVSGDFTLNASGTTEITGDLTGDGAITADSIGFFHRASKSVDAGSNTQVGIVCPRATDVLVACSGKSTTNNFLGAAPNSEATGCVATRSSTVGTLTVYTYCFDPTASE